MEAQLLDDNIYSELDGSKHGIEEVYGILDHGLSSSKDTCARPNDDSDALVRQIQDEVDVESRYDKFTQQQDDALEERYRALKQGRQPAPSPLTQVPKPMDPSEFFDEVDDWCCICNEDATWICEGCDNDKFCNACFYEGHQSDMASYEAMQHKAKKWTKSK
ncbi:hypothetical protein BX666DRAFT_1382070 [Dichotomocladium elegans]|nr:hypothetical protein BX666DRAFT_1382070 [Dichotomocladium elegans]